MQELPRCEREGLRIHLAGLDEAEFWVPKLSLREKRRAEEVVHPAVRAGFVVSRGLRRTVLAGMMGLPAASLDFREGEGEKPRLDLPAAPDFNHSHAGDHVVLAVAETGSVGIDLEKRREVRDMAAIVSRYFHQDEVAAWQRLRESEREAGFFVLWSAREAAVKCAGVGLARGLSVTRIDPGILGGDEASGDVGGLRVRLRKVSAPEGYVMVLARA